MFNGLLHVAVIFYGLKHLSYWYSLQLLDINMLHMYLLSKYSCFDQVWNYKLRRCLFTLLGHLDYIRTTFFHHVSCSATFKKNICFLLCFITDFRVQSDKCSKVNELIHLTVCFSVGVPLDSECLRWPDYPHLELAVQDLRLVTHTVFFKLRNPI